MIDYHANGAALDEFISTLRVQVFPDPEMADAQRQALDSVDAAGGSALLGSFVHHLISQAASSGVEVALLERASEPWGRGLSLCAQLGKIRADLEGALSDPAAPESPARFDAAAVSAQDLGYQAYTLWGDVGALRGDAIRFPYLPEHPRQRDKSSDAWDWGDLVLGRRTDAFVRNLHRRAVGTDAVAFAVGATSSYGANVAGSAYIGAVVGGPRRSHRHRDRLARNAVGAWLSRNHPAATTPSAMCERVTFGSPANPTLPADLEALVTDALSDTFDFARTAPLPDLRLGYRRLVRHLSLLDGFTPAALPVPPSVMWQIQLFGDVQSPPTSLRPQDADLTGQDGGGIAGQYGPNSTGSSTPDRSDNGKSSGLCGVLAALVILVGVVKGFIHCLIQWADGETCTFWDNLIFKELWEQDPPDPRDPNGPTNPGVTADQLTAIAGSPKAAELVGRLFDIHNQAWEAMDQASVFLAAQGLIYPGPLGRAPLYSQFTSAPGALPWPHREEPDPETTYQRFPVSPLELPTVAASLSPAGSTPAAFLGQAGAAGVTLRLWRQIAAGAFDSFNRDLDADRGWNHPCWAAEGSVHDAPVDVRTLAYDEQ